jgi:hypothetical protein
MEEDFYLDDKAFAFCGFGVEQLRMLGSRAPEEMITSRLEKDLGL